MKIEKITVTKAKIFKIPKKEFDGVFKYYVRDYCIDGSVLDTFFEKKSQAIKYAKN